MALDSRPRSKPTRKNHSRWRKVIQQKRGCHRCTYFDHAGSNGDDPRALDSARHENETLDAADRRVREVCFDCYFLGQGAFP
jgi:hypothetical protein